MKLKNIVNQDIVNLQNCEDELIHIPGSIQPHGFLLGIRAGDFIIDFCSSNAFDLTGITYEQFIGKKLEMILGEKQSLDLTNYTNSLDHLSTPPILLTVIDKAFYCTVQKTNDIILLEFEPWSDEHLQLVDIYKQTRQVTTYMQNDDSLEMLCQHVADETRKATGYDRVMIYRFDEEFNGNVYAESKIEQSDSWLHLHYPHTDIPAQARALYLKNLLRIIPDVNYTPAVIYTVDDVPGKNLDLSLSILRSSSPIHIQYLKNIAVSATLTISLIHQEKLWGLIACHHNSPKYLNNDIRLTAQLQGHFLTSQISVRELAEEYKIAKKVNAALDNLLLQVFSNESVAIKELVKQPDLLKITNASSVVIILDDEIFMEGDLPAVAEIKKLAIWLHTYGAPTGLHISSLSSVYPDAKKWSGMISGVIFHSLGSGLSNCIFWCRPEAIREIHWAGDPNEIVTKTEQALSPRRSFQLFKELKQFESRKWENPEVLAATNFANAFQKHLNLLFLTKEELKQRNLNNKLKEANSELENLYWIGSHDLKEPLRKIQMFASRIMNEEYAGDFKMIFDSVKRMNDSAKRMQVLVSDILSYSRLSYVDDDFEVLLFSDLIRSAIEELDPEIKEQQAVIEFDTAVDIKGISFFLQQLLVNLFRNALKFSKPGVPPRIIIRYEGETNFDAAGNSSLVFYKITFTDNGIGFDSRFRESIFKVFTRLHKKNEYTGSGVGLALCSKIMKNHRGYITADGELGIGTTINLFFPVI